MRILVFGDSIAQGFWDSQGGWVERLRKHYDARALADLRNHNEPAVFNLGISGDTTRNLLERVELETRVRKWPGDPLIVVLSIGTNDDLFENGEQWIRPEEFRQNIQKLIAILRPLTDGLMFVGNAACDESKTTPVSWGDYSYTNAEMKKFEQIVSEEAERASIPFVPIFDEFKNKLDIGEHLLADGLHPNDAGHEFIYRQVLPKLEELLKTR